MPNAKTHSDGSKTYFSIQGIIDKADEFLIHCDEKEIAPTFVEFERFLGVAQGYLYELPSTHSDSVKEINRMFENYHTQKGLKGVYNTPFHIFYMKNKFKWSDKHEVTSTQTVNKVIRELPEKPEE